MFFPNNCKFPLIISGGETQKKCERDCAIIAMEFYFEIIRDSPDILISFLIFLYNQV
jgi:hypothetical protein